MDEFADVARARDSYKKFAAALGAGRAILQRAGAPDPPAIPEFDVVYRRLSSESRRKLFADLKEAPDMTPPEIIRLWMPHLKQIGKH